MALVRRLRVIEILLVLLIVGVISAVLWPVYTSEGPSPTTSCISQVKQMILGCLMYSADNDDRLPLAPWMDGTQPYVKNEAILHDPIWKKESVGNYGYAFDSRLFGVDQRKLPNDRALIYDSTSIARNAADPMSSLPSPGRHKGVNVLGFADGHAKSVRSGQQG
jgi:hypothetical protein